MRTCRIKGRRRGDGVGTTQQDLASFYSYWRAFLCPALCLPCNATCSLSAGRTKTRLTQVHAISFFLSSIHLLHQSQRVRVNAGRRDRWDESGKWDMLCKCENNDVQVRDECSIHIHRAPWSFVTTRVSRPRASEFGHNLLVRTIACHSTGQLPTRRDPLEISLLIIQ